MIGVRSTLVTVAPLGAMIAFAMRARTNRPDFPKHDPFRESRRPGQRQLSPVGFPKSVCRQSTSRAVRRGRSGRSEAAGPEVPEGRRSPPHPCLAYICARSMSRPQAVRRFEVESNSWAAPKQYWCNKDYVLNPVFRSVDPQHPIQRRHITFCKISVPICYADCRLSFLAI